MKKTEYHFPSATGECEIHGFTYTPDNDAVRGVLVLHHGMAEHQGRYQDFISFLTDNGIKVYMHDMANHGISNQDFAISGYFGKRDGYKGLVADLNTTFEKAKSENPDKSIVVMGHSMGSFITRCFTAWYNNAGFSGAIYMGTGGSNPILGLGDAISSVTAKLTGYKKKVALLDKIAFGAYNDKFEKRTSFDWLTRDNAIVDKYIDDKYCGFLFSAQGMNDLIRLNIECNKDEWYSSVPKDTALLVISGEMDPVGNYGKGLEEVCDKLVKTGHSRAELKLFKDCRHEILNELNKDEVYNTVLDFINRAI